MGESFAASVSLERVPLTPATASKILTPPNAAPHAYSMNSVISQQLHKMHAQYMATDTGLDGHRCGSVIGTWLLCACRHRNAGVTC